METRTKYYISSPKRAKDWNADANNLVLGERHCDDWVELLPENECLYNSWFSEEAAKRYIEHHELEDCEIIAIEYCSEPKNNMSEDKWEDSQEGMRYYGAEYDPVLDEYC